MNKYRRIKYEDRCQIYALSKRGSSQESIAEVLGVSQSAVSREIHRNRGERGYWFKQAEAKAQARQAIRSKPRKGKEFAAHQDIAHALKAKIFFATPYHAWERGLNENTNGLIRDFFPKGTDFSTIANAEVAKVERLLNARPRKSLGFRSPQEVFDSLAHS